MYSHGDSHSELTPQESEQGASESDMPGGPRREAALGMATGRDKDVLRLTVGGATLEAVPAPRPWFLAYTRPGQERLAQQNLAFQAYESYLPQFRRIKKTAADTIEVVEPMFPRYVFFRAERAGQSITPVGSTRGISHIVRFGQVPAMVQPDTLGIIRQLEQERNMVGEAPMESLQLGQKVRLLDPAFHGLEGLVKSASSRRVAASENRPDFA